MTEYKVQHNIQEQHANYNMKTIWKHRDWNPEQEKI